MKSWLIVISIALLQACANTNGDHVAANSAPSTRSASQASEPSSVALYSAHFFQNFAAELNRNTKKAMLSKVNSNASLDYIEPTREFSTEQRADLSGFLSSLSDSIITRLAENDTTTWTYIDKQENADGSVFSYYRATVGRGAYTYYQFAWMDGSIVDSLNLYTGSGLSETFYLLIEMDGYRHKNGDKGVDYVDDFFTAIGNDKSMEVMFAYNDMPKYFKQHSSVLSRLMDAYERDPSIVMPKTFGVYMEKEKPIHPRYFSYYYNQRQFESALACLQAFPEPVTKDVRVQVEIANVQYSRGKKQLSEAILVDSILQFPNQVFGYIWLLGLSLDTQQNDQTELLLKVLHDRFETSYSKQDLLDFNAGENFVKSVYYQRYVEHLN